MVQVTVNYKMLVGVGQHRQPRSTGGSVGKTLSDGGDPVVGNTPFAVTADQHRTYTTDNGQLAIADFAFWNETDGHTGVIHTDPKVQIDDWGSNETLTAWYRPRSGAGGGGGPVLALDAFSSALDRLVDDSFVEVDGQKDLSATVNAAGAVDTAAAHTLHALSPLVGYPSGAMRSTDEPFSQWQLNQTPMATGTASLPVAEGTSGTALAFYARSRSEADGRRPWIDAGRFAEWVRIGPGVAVDGGGWTSGGPVGPLGPLVARLLRAIGVVGSGVGMDKAIGAKLTALAAEDALAAIRTATPELERLAHRTRRE